MENTRPDESWVTVFQSSSFQAEVEAQSVLGLLQSAGIESILVRENVPELPTGQVFVRTLETDAEAARELIRDAQPLSGDQQE